MSPTQRIIRKIYLEARFMVHSMLQDTMVNMKWPDIQSKVQENAIVLIPIGVIEEHGPQLPLGTDIYTAHIKCMYIKDKLESNGHSPVIAPPFYWGVCQATGGFIGSFNIKKDTAKALMIDILESIASFGFKNTFGINAHGDIEQNVMLIESFREAVDKTKMNARYTFDQTLLHHYRLNGNEPFICPIKPQSINISQSKYPDVHGGDVETATMAKFYPSITDVEKAKTLEPVSIDDELIMKWLFGGFTKELSPNGYLGAPSDFESVDVEQCFRDVAERLSAAILNCI